MISDATINPARPLAFVSAHSVVAGGSRMVEMSYRAFGKVRAFRDSEGTVWIIQKDLWNTLGLVKSQPGLFKKRIQDPQDVMEVAARHLREGVPLQALSEGAMHVALGISKFEQCEAVRRWFIRHGLPVIRNVRERRSD